MATSSKTCITRYGIITDIDTGDKETGFSVNVDAEVILDFNKDGELTGIEILFNKKTVERIPKDIREKYGWCIDG